MIGRPRVDIVRRLMEHTDVDLERDCTHLWTGALAGNEHAQLTWGGPNGRPVSIGVHRLALILATKEEPAGLLALHTCDVGHCLTPEHLYWGTYGDNLRDAWERERRRGHSAAGRERDDHGRWA